MISFYACENQSTNFREKCTILDSFFIKIDNFDSFGGAVLKRILLYLKPFRLRMLVGFIVKVTGTMAELVLPYILTHILVVINMTISTLKNINTHSILILFPKTLCHWGSVCPLKSIRIKKG